MLMQTPRAASKDQRGMVAIFSVLVIMGILTLLTIGFSNITRQAQKRALDDHLNTQAFYAAESGISMAVKEIRDGQNESKESCKEGWDGFNYDVDAGAGIDISCLLVDLSLPDLVWSDVAVAGTGEPAVGFLQPESESADSLSIEWDCDGQCDILDNSNLNLLPADQWGQSLGMLRVDLVPANIAPSDRGSLVAGSYSFYLYPREGGTTNEMTVSPGIGGQGAALVTTCNSPGEYRCRANINLSAVSPSYYIRLQSFYNPVNVRVRGIRSGAPLQLVNGQAVVDVTGRANDVYRRLQVRVPIFPNASYLTGRHETFAVFGADSICKKYRGVPAPGSSYAEDICSF